MQVVEQESRLPLDLTRDSSKLAGREVRIVQTRQEDEDEEDKDKSTNFGQSRLNAEDWEGKKSTSSLQDGSKVTAVVSEKKLGGKEMCEVVSEGKM